MIEITELDWRESRPAEHRVCGTANCGTVLSRYGSGLYCWLCTQKRTLEEQLEWTSFYAACRQYGIPTPRMHQAVKDGLVRRDHRGVNVDDVERLAR